MSIMESPFENANSILHKYHAHIILKLSANGINVFEFVKKKHGVLHERFNDTKFCDAQFVNELLQSKDVRVIVLNKDDRVLARNWVI